MTPTYEQVGELARLSVSREDSASLQYVEGLIQAGMSLETVYENLLVAAARRLGEFWTEDACDFSDVTVGMIRLQKIQRTLSRDMRQSKSASAATKVSKLALRRALIVPMPGEQHTIGATIVQDFFARAGWQVVAALPQTDNDLVSAVRHDSYDMVGLTLSRDDKLQELSACVALVRCASRNKNVVIAVGGPPFVADPLRADAVGADATGSTGAEAVAAVDAALSRALEPA
ncbi:MAG: cobalamin B12-binding domain-containing protein [Verrucomicrobiae bacterium]|nr:cobalamin B12-binding domain-containing protein [Verrucomicrobiae bacterium]